MTNKELAQWLPEIFERAELVFEPSLWPYDCLPTASDLRQADAERRWKEASGGQPVPTARRSGRGELP